MLFRIFYSISLLCTIYIVSSKAQVPAPAAPQEKPVLLVGATAHLGNGNIIKNAVISFEEGKITQVIAANTIQVDTGKYEVIHVEGKHVYPGLILANTTLGLTEIELVRATRDFREVGSLNPNVRSIIAYNTDSELTPTVRFNGILLAQVCPRGGLVSGSSSVVELDAWNWEDAVYKMDGGIHLNWPAMFTRPRWWEKSTEIKKNEKYEEKLEEIQKLFEDALTYSQQNNKQVTNLKLKAMSSLFNGEKTLFIHTNFAKEIIEGIQFAKKYKVKKIVLVGARDAWLVKNLLKENNIPVILNEIHRLPRRTDEAVDIPFELPYLLHKEGILVSLGYASTRSARNLPFLAGTAAAYGLSKEEALMLITSNTAKILGINEHVGTLERGKDATLVISEGDILDMRTNHIIYAFIRGKKLDLNGKQQALYERFKKKYEQKQ